MAIVVVIDTTTGTTAGKRITLKNEADGTVSINMGRDTFVDVFELFNQLEGLAAVNVVQHQATLNHAMRRFIAGNQHYVNENLGALGYFNQVATVIGKSVELINELHPVLEKHLHEAEYTTPQSDSNQKNHKP